MLLVPTYVAPSRIAGVGLFAGVDLPSGEKIWEFSEEVDVRIPPEDFAEFPEPYRSRFRHYLYREESGLFVLCGDNARFMNHDADPNCSDADPRMTVTRRPVARGEELTCNYYELDLDTRRSGLDFEMESAD